MWRRDRVSARDAAGWLPALLVEMPPRKESLELPPPAASAPWPPPRDLGGDLSTQERVLVDLATTTKLLLGSIDSWLLTQNPLSTLAASPCCPRSASATGLPSSSRASWGSSG